MDKLLIQDLRVPARIGVYQWEKCIYRKLSIDIEMAVDIKSCVKNDDITLATDYANIVQSVTDFIQESQFSLIETLAEHLAQWLISKFGIYWLKLRVTKLGIFPQVKAVAIEIERSSSAFDEIKGRVIW
jgi:dihydroneopterin aldolase